MYAYDLSAWFTCVITVPVLKTKYRAQGAHMHLLLLYLYTACAHLGVICIVHVHLV